jgi:uncharacterized protein (DUF2249 family)
MITPDTKVGTLLDAFPELEELLIEMAPPFAKLRSPVLRKTVAKVTSLRQAATVGGIDLGVLITRLREAAGVTGEDVSSTDSVGISSERPDWLESGEIVETFDARPVIEAGEHALGAVMKKLKALTAGQVLELITPFEPAPLIDKAREQGFTSWSTTHTDGTFRTFFHMEV